jgi:hypothetical protein
MWYNGTSLSEKARRAMEKEKVTIVSHISGYIHSLYKEATIDKTAYRNFSIKLKEYLVTDLTNLIFINFLRFKSKYKALFQFMCECSGKQRYISLDKMFEYEHTSKFSVSAETRASLVKEIEGDEFHLSPIQGKIIFNNLEEILQKKDAGTIADIEKAFIRTAGDEYKNILHEMFIDLNDFIYIEPKIPGPDKEFVITDRLNISLNQSREEILSLIYKSSENSEHALLALYVYRDMDKTDWRPFIKAAIERNPVCFKDLEGKTNEEVFYILQNMSNTSIYDEKRLALPDEVWNFKRGDGIEKALLLSDFIMHSDGKGSITIKIEGDKVILTTKGVRFQFISDKNMNKTINISGKVYNIN